MKAYIMIGLTGSGKSSWARMTAKTNFNTIRVSNDDIRSMIKDRYTFDYQLEPLVRKMGDALVEQVLLDGKNVIIDDCHLTVEHRRELCELVKRVAPTVEIIYVWVWCCPEVCLQRRLTDVRGGSKLEWAWVVDKMDKVFETPQDDECGEDVNIILTVVKNEASYE